MRWPADKPLAPPSLHGQASTPRCLRLLLADDHPIVREGCRRVLADHPDLRLEAEATSGQEAYRLWQELEPDVGVIDLALPEMGGIELIRRITQRCPGARLLAYGMRREALYAVQALRAGALGYVSKRCPPEALITALQRVARGERVLSPDVAARTPAALLDAPEAPLHALSPREFEILRLLLEGRSAPEIGAALHISPKTAQNCHYQIKAKLGVRSDIELVRLALALGLMQ